MSAADRAALALMNSQAMCDLLAACRTHRVPGWWDGSAFRSHPVGLIVGVVKLTNHWHVDHLCTIDITDGTGWDRNVCQDSCAHGNPHPRQMGGGAVQVWRCGAWASPDLEAALRPRLMQILTDAAEHIEKAEAAALAAATAVAAQSQAARAAQVAAAVAKAVQA